MECPICCSELEDAVQACRTRCNHIFCRECLLRTLELSSPSTAWGICPMCRGAVSVFSTVCLSDDEPLRKPGVSTIFGSVYVQGHQEGVASYHFRSAGDDSASGECYISYAAAPAAWLLGQPATRPVRFSDAPSAQFLAAH